MLVVSNAGRVDINPFMNNITLRDIKDYGTLQVLLLTVREIYKCFTKTTLDVISKVSISNISCIFFVFVL